MLTMASDVAILRAVCSSAQSQYTKNLNAAEHDQSAIIYIASTQRKKLLSWHLKWRQFIRKQGFIFGIGCQIDPRFWDLLKRFITTVITRVASRD